MVVMVDKSTGTIENVHTENRHLESFLAKGLVRVGPCKDGVRLGLSRLQDLSYLVLFWKRNVEIIKFPLVKHVEARRDCIK